MNKDKEKKISKQLSYVLRHKPESIGMSLDSNGWLNVIDLIEKIGVTMKELEYVVEHNAKQRFSFDSSKEKIRASQGHSVDINLELQSQEPPKILYHGTAVKNLESILKNGIKRMNRQHVHLSAEIETARQVGARHGKVIILNIDCDAMSKENLHFYLSENEVWLTDYVDPKFITNAKDLL